LASTNINLCIYISPEYEQDIKQNIGMFSNVKIMNVIDLSSTWIYNLCKELGETTEIELPANRNNEKDTYNFILNGHTKHQFMEDVIDKNPWNSSHFAWIDFNIYNLFRNKVIETTEYLKWLSNITLGESFITFPGCWNKLEKEKVSDIIDSVHWRFCGSFFIGDCVSMKNFCRLYWENIQKFLQEHKKLIWDFNFWAWMETFCEEDFKPMWYRGDHNDSILYSSADIYTRKLENIISKKEYNYPTIDKYYPTSASYIYYQDRHWLNTRYVNYWIYPTGCYHFNSGTKLIENENMLSELSNENLEPLYFKKIVENIDLSYNDTFSKGLEDVRLYEYNKNIKYIATTAGYSPNGKSKMIVGDYDLENAEIKNGQIIESPNADSWCEKNWIPIIKNNTIILSDGSTVNQEEEMFIYKWYPLEIGKINYSWGEECNDISNSILDNKKQPKLEIIHSYQITMPIFSKIRGSTIFQETDEGLLGVVHYSEEHAPRHYYHMLVLLDKDTFMLRKYSETFCFEKLGIEFCIGFTIRYSDNNDEEDEYVFWISRHDRDPIMITVGVNEIKWMNKM
jgi:hypothetical protein